MTDTTVLSNQQTEEQRKAQLDELEKLDPNAHDPEDDDEAGDAGASDEQSEEEKKQAADAAAAKAAENADDDDDSAADDTADDAAAADDKKKPPVATDAKDEEMRKKLANSAAEAQILQLRTKSYQDKVAEAQKLPEPTETELITAYGVDEWEELSPVMKSIAKENLHNKNKNKLIESINEQVKNDEQYVQKVEAFAVHPDSVKKFPWIEGREDEFLTYASKPTRRGLDLEDVALIFKGVIPEKKKAKSASLFPRNGASQDKTKPAAKTVSADQSKAIRETDPKKHMEMIRTGKIKPADLLN